MTSQPKVAPPYYRVASQAGVFSDGLMRPFGSEFASNAWPLPGTEAINEPAKRIMKFWRSRQASVGFPRSPWHPIYGLYLPGILQQFGAGVRHDIFNPAGGEIRGLVSDADVDPGLSAMPEYVMAFSHRVGHREMAAGERLIFVGWPDSEMFVPSNAPAHAVSAYYAENHDNPKLLTSPWCWLRGLLLPELPAMPRAGKLALDTAKYADAVAGEIEAITGRRPGAARTVPTSTPSAFTSGVGRQIPPSAIINRPMPKVAPRASRKRHVTAAQE
jgi:hypothetical protein